MPLNTLGPLTVTWQYRLGYNYLKEDKLEKPLAELLDGPPHAAEYLANLVAKDGPDPEDPTQAAVLSLVDKCLTRGFQRLVDAFEGGDHLPTPIACGVLTTYLLQQLSQPNPAEELVTLKWIESGQNPSGERLYEVIKRFVTWSRESFGVQREQRRDPIPHTPGPETMCMHLMVYAALIAQNTWAATFAQKLYLENAALVRRDIEDKDPRSIAIGIIERAPHDRRFNLYTECHLIIGHIESLLNYGNEHPPKRRRRNAVDER